MKEFMDLIRTSMIICMDWIVRRSFPTRIILKILKILTILKV